MGKRVFRRIIEKNMGYITPCHIWQLSCTSGGYGKIKYTDSEGYKRTGSAHRVYWERRYGLVPEGLQINHLCSIRNCVNTDHMIICTPLENSRHSAATKLTTDDIKNIRKEYKENKTEQWQIAANYGVTRQNISAILNNKSWKEI